MLLLLFFCLFACCRGGVTDGDDDDDGVDGFGFGFEFCFGFCFDFGSASEMDFVGLFRFATDFVVVLVLVVLSVFVNMYALMYSLSDAVCVDINSDLLFTGLIDTIEWMGNGVIDLLLDEVVLIVLRMPLTWCPLRCSNASAPFVSTVISDMTSHS